MRSKTLLGLCFVVLALASQPARAESRYDKGYKDAIAHLQPNDDSADYQAGWQEGHEQASTGEMQGEEPSDTQGQQEAEPEETQSNPEL